MYPIMRLFFSHMHLNFEKYFYQLCIAFLITFTALFQYRGFFFHYIQDTFISMAIPACRGVIFLFGELGWLVFLWRLSHKYVMRMIGVGLLGLAFET